MASTREWFESVAEAQRRAKRRLPSMPALLTFHRTSGGVKLALRVIKLLHGRD